MPDPQTLDALFAEEEERLIAASKTPEAEAEMARLRERMAAEPVAISDLPEPTEDEAEDEED